MPLGGYSAGRNNSPGGNVHSLLLILIILRMSLRSQLIEALNSDPSTKRLQLAKNFEQIDTPPAVA